MRPSSGCNSLGVSSGNLSEVCNSAGASKAEGGFLVKLEDLVGELALTGVEVGYHSLS